MRTEKGTGPDLLFWIPVPRWRSGSSVKGGIRMLNFEEELKKFQPSLEVEDIENAVYQEDLTDMTDILREMIEQTK
mgnify:CR=1 FL=1